MVIGECIESVDPIIIECRISTETIGGSRSRFIKYRRVGNLSSAEMIQNKNIYDALKNYVEVFG